MYRDYEADMWIFFSIGGNWSKSTKVGVMKNEKIYKGKKFLFP